MSTIDDWIPGPSGNCTQPVAFHTKNGEMNDVAYIFSLALTKSGHQTNRNNASALLDEEIT